MKALLVATGESGWAGALLGSLEGLPWRLRLVDSIEAGKSELESDFDVVLFDTFLCGSDVVQAVRHFKAGMKHGARLLLLYDPDHDSGRLAVEALQAKVDGFIPDNLGHTKLPTRIESVLRSVEEPTRAIDCTLPVRRYPLRCFVEVLRECGQPPVDMRSVFVATPYGEELEYMHDYVDGIIPALDYLGLKETGPRWRVSYGPIGKAVCCGIHQAAVGIANVSPVYEPEDTWGRRWWQTNPNVAFEVGLMMERGMVVIPICRYEAWHEAQAGVFSDIQGLRLLIYESRIHLAEELIRRLRTLGLGVRAPVLTLPVGGGPKDS